MSKSDYLESAYLKMVFNGTALANIMDNAAVGPNSFLSVALHTADPGDAGTQATSETAYTGYARVFVARTTGGWTVSGTAPTQAAPFANIDFPACTGGTSTITYFSVGIGQVSGAAGSITCTAATPGVFTWTAHGLAVGQAFYFLGTAPTGLTAGVVYYVQSATINTFQIAATAGGTALATTGTGASMIGFAAAGATSIFYSGTVTPNIAAANGVTPRLTTASTMTED
jgi:hypothetical protein